MSQFDESKHNRHSDGKFTYKPHAEAEGIGLTPPPPPATTSTSGFGEFPDPQAPGTRENIARFIKAAGMDIGGTVIDEQNDGTYAVYLDPPNHQSLGLTSPMDADMADVYQQSVNLMGDYPNKDWFNFSSEGVSDPKELQAIQDRVDDDERYFQRKARDIVALGLAKGTVYPTKPLTVKESLAAADKNGFLTAVVKVDQGELQNVLEARGFDESLDFIAEHATTVPPYDCSYDIIGGDGRGTLQVKYTSDVNEAVAAFDLDEDEDEYGDEYGGEA